ncbi:MAG: type III polyketide synthase [Acidobacteria bacterium]|nr:type III polyketide synthase [Acidobacteriota bacterium]
MTDQNHPRIVSVGTATPPFRFTQDEVLRLLGYDRPIAREIFLNSDIEVRYLHVDPARVTTPDEEDLDVLHRRYREGALLIARQAAERCLAQAGLGPADVDCILVCSCTGYLCPDLATILVKEMGLPWRVQRGSLLGLGCAGALPTLQRAYDHAQAYPDHRVLAVAVEICSAAYYIDNTLETVVGNAICADGAAACLLTRRAERGPRLVGFASVLNPSCQSSVGFEHRQGRLRIVLAPTIRDLAPPIVDRVLDELLPPRGLKRSDIRFWVMHPGGRKVIDRLQESLGLSDADVALSRHILRNYGNMSSPTVLFVLNEVMKNGAARPGDRGVLLALGPGFAAEAALLEW